jgi:MoaA/NifB/PqqE/SkfB family radical SAM enzyme
MINVGEKLKIDGISFSHIQWSTPEISKSVLEELNVRLGWLTPESRIIEAMENSMAVKSDNLANLLAQIDSIKKNHQNRHLFYVQFLPNLLTEEIISWYSPGIHKIDFCNAPKEWLRIGVDGDVQPICALIPFPFGNLANQSLKEILAGGKAKRFYEEIETNGFFYACQRCCRRAGNSRII